MTGATLVGVGHVAIDHLFYVDTTPQPGHKTPARQYRCVVGGMTANACVAAARLGASVRIVAPVGQDAALPRFAEHFSAQGVQCDGLLPVADASSSVSAVLVDGHGERTIINHRGDALSRAPAFDERWLDGAALLLTDPRCVAWSEAALRAAGSRGLPSVLDADTAPRPDLQRLVGLAGWTVFSQPGAAAWQDGPPQTALAAALAAGAGVAVVTLGAAGLMWQRAGQPPQQLPAFDVGPVVDTTGAGDAFHGALGVALAEGQPPEQALRFAAATAALKCLQPGGVLGTPARPAVLQLMAQQHPTPPASVR